MISSRVQKIRTFVKVMLQKLGYKFPKQLFYVAPEANWSVDWDAHYITEGVYKQFELETEVIANPRWLVGQIVHYGALGTFLGSLKGVRLQNNTNVVTVFHGDPNDKRFSFGESFRKLLEQKESIARLVVSNKIMHKRFVELGFPQEKIARVPLGVDLSVFRPGTEKQKENMRERLGIPKDAFCIGSFHKDGNGWDEGLSPKLIKGPDILLETLGKLQGMPNVFVLLTGPSRGYVIRGLKELGVSYAHQMVEKYEELPNYFHALDAYIVPSREEGGPKGVLEALACGAPLVSTKVGMAPDVIQHGENGLLADIEDAETLAEHLVHLSENPKKAKQYAVNGLVTIRDFDWLKIAKLYYKKVYEELLQQ